jgi:hypothetical protein
VIRQRVLLGERATHESDQFRARHIEPLNLFRDTRDEELVAGAEVRARAVITHATKRVRVRERARLEGM